MAHSPTSAPRHRKPSRIALRVAVGAAVGGLVGAVLAVNVVIYSGIEGGYEAIPREWLEQNPAIGILAVLLLVIGPIAGAFIAIRRGAGHRSSGRDD